MASKLTALKGWGAVGVLVLMYEALAPAGELLSEGVDRSLEKHPVATHFAVITTAAHLLNLIPTRVDPYHMAFRVANRYTRREQITTIGLWWETRELKWKREPRT